MVVGGTGGHLNPGHPSGVTQCLALDPGAQLFCCMPSPDWGIRGCELWDLGVSQEESGGPSVLHLEPPFLVLEAKESRARPAVFTDTSSVPSDFGRRLVDDLCKTRELQPKALYLENQADC